MSRQTQANIHADALIHNAQVMRRLTPNGRLMAVLKADAYGHGAVLVAHLLKDYCDAFAVAIPEEAMVLRQAGVRTDIVVLEGPHQAEDCALAADLSCTLVAHCEEQLQWIERVAQPNLRVWLKIDSGMHRLGFSIEQTPKIIEQYQHLLDDESVLLTHLANADNSADSLTATQIHRFSELTKRYQYPVSIANSPAALLWPMSHADWNRLGLALYGGQIAGALLGNEQLQPAMTLTASIIALRNIKAGDGVGYGQVWHANRDSVIATVGIGYADGYPRHCPNGTPVVVRGQKVPLVGRVSMDMITIDVTDIADVKLGDRAELWGRNVSISQVAECAGTIDYELMTRISKRVPRVVV